MNKPWWKITSPLGEVQFDKYAKEIAIHPNLKSVLTVKREFLQAELDQIKTTLGSVEKFLKTVLEVDISAFRKQFLY